VAVDGEAVADARRRAKLNGWFTQKMRPMFDGRVLPVSEDVMFNGACSSRKSARPAIRSPARLIIAATALHHGLTVVSRDTRD
jgi:predicted nucleic acid-binding protein